MRYALKKPISLDAFARVCGHFVGDTNVNNGYGCDHPENDHPMDGDELNDDGTPETRAIFKCYQFSCPLASAIYEDNPEDVALMRAAGFADDEWSDDGNWMQPWR